MAMLTTDAHVFFNLADPVSAWGVARGVVVTAPVAKQADPRFVSLRMASLFRDVSHDRFRVEMFLEATRATRFPEKISRLIGAYCFPDRASAEYAAAKWSRPPFFLSNLTEVHLYGDTRRDRHDSNWVTHAPVIADEDFLLSGDSWADRYWRGDIYPHCEPIWEMLTDGRMVILDGEKQRAAFGTVEALYPQSLGILEIGRAAAWVGSDLGNTQACLLGDAGGLRLTYLLDMRDADSPDFIARLEREKPVLNWHLIAPHVANGSFGNVPDFTDREFLLKGANIVSDQQGHPYLAWQPSALRS
jgi:hypothetical protein